MRPPMMPPIMRGVEEFEEPSSPLALFPAAAVAAVAVEVAAVVAAAVAFVLVAVTVEFVVTALEAAALLPVIASVVPLQHLSVTLSKQ